MRRVDLKTDLLFATADVQASAVTSGLRSRNDDLLTGDGRMQSQLHRGLSVRQWFRERLPRYRECDTGGRRRWGAVERGGESVVHVGYREIRSLHNRPVAPRICCRI